MCCGEYSEEYLEIAKLLCAVDGIDVVIIIYILSIYNNNIYIIYI